MSDRPTLTARRLGAALVVASVVLGCVLLFIGSRWGEGMALSDPRRRVLVHPLHAGESLRVPFFATTDVVRVALHGVARSTSVVEPYAELTIVHRGATGVRTEHVRVVLPTKSSRTRLEERIAFAWDAEAVNVDVAREGPGEVELTLDHLEGVQEVAARAYRREPADLHDPSAARIDLVELGELGDLPKVASGSPKRSSWHRASVIASRGGQTPVRALVLGPPVAPDPIPMREHVAPQMMRKLVRATPGRALIVEATAVALVVRVGAFVPIDNDASDHIRLNVRVEGGPLARPVVESIDELRAMSRAVAYESGSPATEELAFHLVVPRGARAVIEPASPTDFELREIDIDLFDHTPEGNVERPWLAPNRPPSNAREGAFEQVVLLVDDDLPVPAPRVLERITARGEVPRPLLPFTSSGRQAHVPLHVPRSVHATVVIDGGKPRRKNAAIARRLTAGVRTFEVAEVADVLVGDDLVPGEHTVEVYDRETRLLIEPVLKLPAHWMSGGALGGAVDEIL